jgi:glycine dehydrogenase subunit 1
MLRAIGAASVDDLFVDVPEAARLDRQDRGLPDHASELAWSASSARWRGKNLVAGEVPFFLGCGAYKHHIPASVDHLIQRGEFLTSYTPYQPEIAQGTLQALFEFQTQVARLYGCDVANASMYDGSTACWEAIGMARRITRRGKAILSAGLHPHYVSVAQDDGALHRRRARRRRCRAGRRAGRRHGAAARPRSTARRAASSCNIPTSSAASPTCRNSPSARTRRARC